LFVAEKAVVGEHIPTTAKISPNPEELGWIPSVYYKWYQFGIILAIWKVVYIKETKPTNNSAIKLRS